MKHFLNLTLAAALMAAGAANAASITSTTGIATPSKVITFDGYDGFITVGPENVGAETGDTVLFTSTPFAELGAYERDLGTNGLWGVGEKFVASDFVTARGELGFSFANPVAAVGAFFNQLQQAAVGNTIRLIAYDQWGNDLESFTYSIDTDAFGYNEGQFLGFSRATADIYGFGIADGTFVLDNLTYAVAAVPEPESIALLFAGLGIIGAAARRAGRREG
ncbi:PEP-CTERM sorting domain-containing protein [Piscinibacter gummiphilus]|uniref:Ice-binding protein C-terminal domain-containing protein n=1 Tax=Piscinibacter gummiphilus TaxID=946333 RepID=A0A1W6L8A7_9BURK|nr:PEP-CTERM sorting domain-containing protein [Piscinibacter gummiphilus]ARN20462.1 hypothetical protein A4W93_11460 [Piscinibacter gummiphilus]ATU65136.1 PEP-CTERM sorting domain-containing protein [Piscinibacter gummiphilus]GLS98467.1 hypothetical protein GCM10007918_57590 [Piscinibacter gummiphilus]